MMNGIAQSDFEQFLNLHEDQLIASGIPGHFWYRLHEKLVHEIYDASTCVMMQQIEYTDESDGDDDNNEDSDKDSTGVHRQWDIVVSAEKVSSSDSNNIFLVDHAWTFEAGSMRQSLFALPNLLQRMASLMDIVHSTTDQQNEEIISEISKTVWKFCRHYKLSAQQNAALLSQIPELQHLMWYVLDEVGSRIQHSDEPTARMVPFYYVPRNLCYSIFWFVTDLQEGDSVTVDYIEHIKDAELRPYYLLPWQPVDFSSKPVEHTYVLTNEFFTSHRIQETLPVACRSEEIIERETLCVYADLEQVKKYLTHPRFTFVDSPEKADILWMHEHFKEFERLSIDRPNTFVNQFPGESILTVKDLLASLAAILAKDSYELSGQSNNTNDNNNNIDEKLSTPWYPITFNLVYELPQFCSYFQSKCNEIGNNKDEETTSTEKNLWILKPWNLGRGLGIIITDNLDRIIKTCDTNPMIASRYITDPVLFYRDDLQANVKFDIRYIVLLHSVKPLTLFAYKVFWLRFANKPFILQDFDAYDRHFTVMNYRAADNLKQIHCDEFIELFNKQYPDYQWSNVERKIHQLLVEIFQGATKYPAPRGLTHNCQSRALYAVDLLLEWRPLTSSTLPSTSLTSERKKDIFPVVCEVNFSPDCERACRYHPDFFNDVFSCLFLNQSPELCNINKLT
uniref:Tubulin--tyrosine ligase-like protein 12 SET-like domain-containing protein n=1 Tax=Trichobilharzia regenti TaxID=157069 RepID=A0AA85J2E2_TRIRE|nr:unnamed protein product [Trichobilharzia regenti]CAH8863148.1 unnamed protein product [Trichobilharzia regenti]CAH8863149.1 unnamed protein product [Trichobilharzia regenti]